MWHYVTYNSLPESWRKEFDAETESKKEAYEKAHPKKDEQNEGWHFYRLSVQLLFLPLEFKSRPFSWNLCCSYPKGLIVAFKLKRITVDGGVQQNSADNDTATEEETPKSMKKTSTGESEERTTVNSDMEEQKSSDDMTEAKEVNAGEATESGDKCTVDALLESEKKGDNETSIKDDRGLSGKANSPISREDLKEAFKKFGTVRVF